MMKKYFIFFLILSSQMCCMEHGEEDLQKERAMQTFFQHYDDYETALPDFFANDRLPLIENDEKKRITSDVSEIDIVGGWKIHMENPSLDSARKIRRNAFYDSSISDEVKCKKCIQVFKGKHSKKRHDSLHLQGNECMICGYLMSKYGLAHELYHDVTIPESLKCHLCKWGFSKEEDFIVHHRVEHDFILGNNESQKTEIKKSSNEKKRKKKQLISSQNKKRKVTKIRDKVKNKCIMCGHIPHGNQVENHERYHTSNDNELKCFKCKVAYADKRGINQHQNKVHNKKIRMIK